MKKITTGITNLDKIFEKGIPTGNITAVTGVPKSSFMRFLPETVNSDKGYRVMINLEQAEAITKHGQCIIREMLDKLKREGFDTYKIRPFKQKFEKIGNTVFPVTYFDDGVIIVDYPDALKF